MTCYLVMVYGLEGRKYWEPAWLEPFSRRGKAAEKLREMRDEHDRPGIEWAIGTMRIPTATRDQFA